MKRIKCTVSKYDWWTVGKVYKVEENNIIVADDGGYYNVLALLRGSDRPHGSITYLGEREFIVVHNKNVTGGQLIKAPTIKEGE